jgi:hypothetical protein
MYKHEMPLDLETLLAVGFTDIPIWYRQRYGLGSLLVENGQSKPSFGVADTGSPGRRSRVSEEAKRTIRNQIGSANGGGSGRGGRQSENRTASRDARIAKQNAQKALEAEAAKKHKEEIELAVRLEEEEKERRALADKYKSLRPEYRSVFVYHDDLASDTFSNGEERNDVMAMIRKREQAGWEEEQAEAKAKAAAAVAVAVAKAPADQDKDKAGPTKKKRGGKSRGGGRSKKH